MHDIHVLVYIAIEKKSAYLMSFLPKGESRRSTLFTVRQYSIACVRLKVPTATSVCVRVLYITCMCVTVRHDNKWYSSVIQKHIVVDVVVETHFHNSNKRISVCTTSRSSPAGYSPNNAVCNK